MGRGSSENRFTNVQVRTWDDPDFCDLSSPPANAQTLWFYFLSGPYTTRVPGVIAGGRAAMAEALGWSQEDFDRCFKEIADKGMAIADWSKRLVYLPKAFHQTPNHPYSPSVCVTWRKALNDLPECDLLRQVDHDLRLLLLELGPAFLDSFDSCKRRDKKAGSADSSAVIAVLPSADSSAAQNHAHSRVRAGEGTGTGRSGSETVFRVEGTGPPPGLRQAAAAIQRHGILTPDPISVGQLCQRAGEYAAKSGEDVGAVAEKAIEAFVKLASTWSAPKPPLPHLVLKHWDEVQAVMGGHDPAAKPRAGPNAKAEPKYAHSKPYEPKRRAQP